MDYADADAVLLLENTKILNYVNVDRQIGFDSEVTRAILKVSFLTLVNHIWLPHDLE